MKTKLLKRLREDANFTIDLIRDLSTGKYIIRKKVFDWEFMYYKKLYSTKNKEEAISHLLQARRNFILKRAGIKKINI